MKLRSLTWSPTIAMSWFWGLGFFYSIHVVLIYGWLGFVGFAIPNAFGLALFGRIVGTRRQAPDVIVKSLEGAFGAAFQFFQIAAAAITIFGFIAYFWAPIFGAGAAIAAVMFVICFCAVGQGLSLSAMKWLHMAALLIAVAAAVALLAALSEAKTAGPVPLAAFDARFYGLVVPTLVGFLLGPWLDLQQWQRAAAIHREGGSVSVAYAGGGLLFLGLLTINALLAAAGGRAAIVVERWLDRRRKRALLRRGPPPDRFSGSRHGFHDLDSPDAGNDHRQRLRRHAMVSGEQTGAQHEPAAGDDLSRRRLVSAVADRGGDRRRVASPSRQSIAHVLHFAIRDAIRRSGRLPSQRSARRPARV